VHGATNDSQQHIACCCCGLCAHLAWTQLVCCRALPVALSGDALDHVVLRPSTRAAHQQATTSPGFRPEHQLTKGLIANSSLAPTPCSSPGLPRHRCECLASALACTSAKVFFE
jgi:hypothetical protein